MRLGGWLAGGVPDEDADLGAVSRGDEALPGDLRLAADFVDVVVVGAGSASPTKAAFSNNLAKLGTTADADVVVGAEAEAEAEAELGGRSITTRRACFVVVVPRAGERNAGGSDAPGESGTPVAPPSPSAMRDSAPISGDATRDARPGRRPPPRRRRHADSSAAHGRHDAESVSRVLRKQPRK